MGVLSFFTAAILTFCIAPIDTSAGAGNCLSNQIYETEITVLDVQGSILENPSEEGGLP
jgi:hypothetical protein